MSRTLTDNASDKPQGRGEGFLHFVAREGQFALRVIIVLAIIATAITMATIFYLVFLPLIVLIFAYVLLAACNRMESATRGATEPEETADEQFEQFIESRQDKPDDPAWKNRKMPMRVFRHEFRLGMEVLFGIGVAAIFLAAMILPPEARVVGAIIVFCYMMFVLAPVWLGWFTTDVEQAYDEAEAKKETE